MSSTRLIGDVTGSWISKGTDVTSATATAVYEAIGTREQDGRVGQAKDVPELVNCLLIPNDLLISGCPPSPANLGVVWHTLYDEPQDPHDIPSSLPETFTADFDSFLTEWEKTDPTFLASPPSSPTLAGSSSPPLIGNKREPPAWAKGRQENDGRPEKKRRTGCTTPPVHSELPAIICTPPSPSPEGSDPPTAEILEMEVPLPLRAMTRLEFYEMHRIPPSRQSKGVSIGISSIPPGAQADAFQSQEPISAVNLAVSMQHQGPSSYREQPLDDEVKPERSSSSTIDTVKTPAAPSGTTHDKLLLPVSIDRGPLDATPATVQTAQSIGAGHETTTTVPQIHVSNIIKPSNAKDNTSSPEDSPTSVTFCWLSKFGSSGRIVDGKPVRMRKEVPLPTPSSHMIKPLFGSLSPFPLTCTVPRSCLPHGPITSRYHAAHSTEPHRHMIPARRPQTRRHMICSVNAFKRPELLTDLAFSTPEWLGQLQDWEFPLLRLLFPERYEIEGNRFWLDHYQTYNKAGIEEWWNQARISAEHRVDTLWQLIRLENRSLRWQAQSPGDSSICDLIDIDPPHITVNPLLRPAARILGYLTVCSRYAPSKTIREAEKFATFLTIGLCISYQLPRHLDGIETTKRIIMNAMPRRAILGLLYLETCGGIDYLADRMYDRCAQAPTEAVDPMVVAHISHITGFAHFGVSKVFDITVDPTLIVLGPIGSITRDTLRQYLQSVKTRSNDYPNTLPRSIRPREHMIHQLPERIAQLLAFTGIKPETGSAVTGWTGRLSQLRVKPKQAFDFGEHHERVFNRKTTSFPSICSVPTLQPSGTRTPPSQQHSYAKNANKSAFALNDSVPSATMSSPKTMTQSDDSHPYKRDSLEDTLLQISREAAIRLPVLHRPIEPITYDARPATPLPPGPFFRPIVLRKRAPIALSARQ